MEMVEHKRYAINTLLEQKRILYSKMSDLDNVKKKIKDHIKRLDNFIYENCDHEWEYYRESSYDSSDYLCKRCGQFQSQYPKK
tara:strand:- start:64 stop:312 length:249 start_codon:yes stop_codon:yes gene_type:complete